MKKTTLFGVVAALLIGIIATGALGVPFGRNEAARTALENNDYNTWKQARISELTEENFNQLRQRFTEDSERRTQMQEHREDIETAMQEGYDAWKAATEDSPRAEELLDVINEDNFDTYVAMHKAMQNKDFETAQELAEELGLERPIGQGPMSGKGHKMHDFHQGRVLEETTEE